MLRVSSINKRYGADTVLKDVSFLLNPGERLGLVGPNGCGKTTLLRLISGREQPDSGAAQLSPPDLRLGYLEQGLTFAPGETVATALGLQSAALAAAEGAVAEVAAALASAGDANHTRLAAQYDGALAELQKLALTVPTVHEAEAALAGLELDVTLDTPVEHLSGGQKTRLGLARLLLSRPQVLLLDEPTNHLDIAGLEWLEAWLQRYPGAALVVSHDRAFLDRTVTGILELDARTHELRTYAGDYSTYVAAKDAELEQQWQEYTDQREEVARLRAAASRLRGLAMPHRGGKADSGDKFAAGFFANRGRFTVSKAKNIEARIEHLLTDERIDKPKPTWQLKVDFSDAPTSGKQVIMLEGLAVGYGDHVLLRGIQQQLRLGERVALVGRNGSGKTTLLRVLAGQLEPLAGQVRPGASVRLGYYSQEQETLDPGSTPYKTIAAIAAMDETETRAFLHYFLFTGDAVFRRIADLSYGERARLALARLVALGCNCLLLDEPINHLDIPSRANFEQALSSFTGTVVAAVHDRYFIRQFATRLWAIEGGELVGRDA